MDFSLRRQKTKAKERGRNTMKKSKVLWGLFFILAAVVVILHTSGLLEGLNPVSVLISVLMLPVLITSIPKRNFWGIFFPTAVILIMNDELLGIEKFTPFPVIISALFLSIGFSLLFPPKKQNFNFNFNFGNGNCNNGSNYNNGNNDFIDIDPNKM